MTLIEIKDQYETYKIEIPKDDLSISDMFEQLITSSL